MSDATKQDIPKSPISNGKSDFHPAPVYDVTKLQDSRTQRLKQLLDKGHITVAPLREPELILHSHLPHLLGSAYGLGAESEQLTECYEHIIKTLKDIDETFIRGESVNENNWRDHLQQKAYTVAYVDFFDEQIQQANGGWTEVVNRALFRGKEPLVNGIMGGLGHPAIHLAYAYEFRSTSVLSEALSLCSTEYGQYHGLLDNSLPDTSTYKTSNLAEVIRNVQADKRFDGLVEYPGTVNFGLVLGPRPEVFLEHWNAWQIDDLKTSFENACDTATLLAMSSGYADGKYDFFHAHMLTVGHALRILWQYIPYEQRKSVLRQFALFIILLYIVQLRRQYDVREIESVGTTAKDWAWVRENALKHKWALDDHFFKVVRALQEMDSVWGSKNGFYLKAAVKFIVEFNGWEGFGQGVMGFLPSRDGYIPA